ncbi:hypothetical protein GWN91_07790, partial [Candidatus Saccharibacteria bacterium]|nr:hypothetical protein [Candidatus Saccharibacteria bacterium]NIV73027.1 hypothetical protein [Calditrichia bacterium]NIW80659.1 hypothetical protein [Calditrichia bacterium]
MAGKVEGIKPPFVPIGGLTGLEKPKPAAPPQSSPFRELLKAKLQDDKRIRFSAHAQTRIESRNMHLDESGFEKLVNAAEQAKSKGAHEALILMENMAFIVNLDNRTVITAMDQEGLKENVFTNIDSAV